MMIHKEKCLELGLPEPMSFDNQETYIVKIMVLGFTINTRMARFVGIHNLHSIAPKLYKKGYEFEHENMRVSCPFTGKTPNQTVIVLSMTTPQITNYKIAKTAKKN